MPKKSDSTKQHIEYHKDGSIWAKGKTVNGVPHGYWEWFRKPARPGDTRGTKMRSGYFDKGKQTGKWTTYDKKGNMYKVTKF